MKIWISHWLLSHNTDFEMACTSLFRKLLHYALEKITICVERLLHFALKLLLHFASMLLHFASVLHFAAILITFCSVTWAPERALSFLGERKTFLCEESVLRHNKRNCFLSYPDRLLLHFALILHFAAIVTFCGVTTPESLVYLCLNATRLEDKQGLLGWEYLLAKHLQQVGHIAFPFTAQFLLLKSKLKESLRII